MNEAGFWHDPVEDYWIKPKPLLEEDEVRLQFFGLEGVYLARDTYNFRKMCSSYWRAALNMTNKATVGSG